MKMEFIEKLPESWLPAVAVFAALGDPVRQKILLLFGPDEELSIKEMADLFPLSRTAVVHHLAVLEEAKILQSRRKGRVALYSLRVRVVLEALEALRLYIHEEFPEDSQS